MKKYFFIVFLFVNIYIFANDYSTLKKHPFYIDVEIFNYNSTSQTFEITLRLFIDDAQKILEKNNIKADLYTDRDTAMVRHFYLPYIQNNVKLWGNQKLLSLQWVGYERDNGAVLFYVESQPISQPKDIQIQTTLLCDYFAQSHLVEIHLQNMMRNSKLDCNNPTFKTQF